jgi:hypothetical protein
MIEALAVSGRELSRPTGADYRAGTVGSRDSQYDQEVSPGR